MADPINRSMLDRNSDRIEHVLAMHKVRGRIRGGIVTPRYIQFQLVTPVGGKVSKISALAEELALALSCQEVRIYRQEGHVNIEMPREMQEPVRLLPLCQRLDNFPPFAAMLGVEDSGTPLLLRLTAPEVAHVLIAGTTGSGKTALARSMLCSLALNNRPDDLKVLLIDPKASGLSALRSLPHVVEDVVSRPDEAVSLLLDLAAEMERRDRNDVSQPVIVVAIDEMADLYLTAGAQFERALARIAQRGRQAGIHLVGCTQKPTASLIGSAVTANFPVRLVGAVASRDEARYATGIPDSGAEKLGGRGDFLMIAKGQTVRFQAAWCSPAEISRIAQISQQWPEDSSGVQRII